MGKIIKRILLIVAAVIVAFALFIAGSVLVDSITSRGRVEALRNTVMPGVNGSPDVSAYVARPAGMEGPLPVVIMIHEFYGLNENIIAKAEGLAEEGYLVIAPDTFRGSTTGWVPRAIFQVITTQTEQVNQDLDAVFQWIEAQPEADGQRVAVQGFCYGGRAALHYSLHNNRLAATVIFYGSPVTDVEVLRSLPGPVLGIFGGADNSIPTQDVMLFKAALDEAGIPNDVAIYDGQPHAFITDIKSVRAGGVQGDAWAKMLGFLDQNLKQKESFGTTVQPNDFSAPFDWRYYLMLAFEHSFGSAHH